MIKLEPVIEIKTLPGYNQDLPTYATDGSAGIDLVSPIGFNLRNGESIQIETKIQIWIKNPGVCGVILPRSSLGRQGLRVKNTIGLIDSDYQGEIIVALEFLDPSGTEYSRIRIHEGARFAQMVFLPIVKPILKHVQEFSGDTPRGEGGFGSTGA